jgi:hypothetical protein
MLTEKITQRLNAIYQRWYQALLRYLPVDGSIPLLEIGTGAVRFRPMMLTAAAVVVGASVILFDPIFQGLAISLMAGEVASLLFSRMTVPILYFLDKRWELAHGHQVGQRRAKSM